MATAHLTLRRVIWRTYFISEYPELAAFRDRIAEMDRQRAVLVNENRELREHCLQLRGYVECLRMGIASMPPRFWERPAQQTVTVDEVLVAGVDEPTTDVSSGAGKGRDGL